MVREWGLKIFLPPIFLPKTVLGDKTVLGKTVLGDRAQTVLEGLFAADWFACIRGCHPRSFWGQSTKIDCCQKRTADWFASTADIHGRCSVPMKLCPMKSVS